LVHLLCQIENVDELVSVPLLMGFLARALQVFGPSGIGASRF
jgi:hypothetical protein